MERCTLSIPKFLLFLITAQVNDDARTHPQSFFFLAAVRTASRGYGPRYNYHAHSPSRLSLVPGEPLPQQTGGLVSGTYTIHFSITLSSSGTLTPCFRLGRTKKIRANLYLTLDTKIFGNDIKQGGPVKQFCWRLWGFCGYLLEISESRDQISPPIAC